MDANQTEPKPCAGSPAATGSGAVARLFVVEYVYGRNRYHTVVEAYDLESAKRQFLRDNPDVEMISCVMKPQTNADERTAGPRS